MKIIVQNHAGNPVFTLDVMSGKAYISPDVSMDAVATEFVHALETLIFGASQYMRGESVRDFLIRAGAPSDRWRSGDFMITMGGSSEGGNNVEVTNADPSSEERVKIYAEGFENGLKAAKVAR